MTVSDMCTYVHDLHSEVPANGQSRPVLQTVCWSVYWSIVLVGWLGGLVVQWVGWLVGWPVVLVGWLGWWLGVFVFWLVEFVHLCVRGFLGFWVSGLVFS